MLVLVVGKSVLGRNFVYSLIGYVSLDFPRFSLFSSTLEANMVHQDCAKPPPGNTITASVIKQSFEIRHKLVA